MKTGKAMQLGLKVLGFVLFGVAVFGLISATDARSTGKVSKVIVDIRPLEGNVFLVENADLAELLKKNYKLKLKDQHVDKLDLNKIESIVEKNDFVRDAQVYIDARNNLKIRVEQRTPVLRVILRDQATFYIDEAGHKLPVSDNAVLRLPVLTGELPQFRNDMIRDSSNVYSKAFNIILAVRKDPFMTGLTEQLVADDKKDISIIPKLGNHRIILGNADDIGNKFKRLEIFYKKGMPSEGWDLYKEINLKYRDQVIARKADVSPIKS